MLLTVVYCLIFPWLTVLRLRDPLGASRSGRPSYWQPREWKPITAESLRRLF